LINLTKKLVKNEILVLLFHGVIPNQKFRIRNYTQKHLNIDNFNSLLHSLHKSGTPISVDELYLHITTNSKIPDNSFVITFDDGFWNNYAYAAPILEELNMPAVFYVTSELIKNNKQTWIDKIESAITQSNRSELKLEILRTTLRIKNEDDKIESLQFLRKMMKHRRDIDLEDFANDLVFQAIGNEELRTIEDIDKKMNWSELKELSDNSLFTIGGHGQTHKILGYLDKEDSQNEIYNSVKDLREFANIVINHYSYPEGFEGSFNEDNIKQLSSLGILSSMTTIDGTVKVGAEPYNLNRFLVS
jgi:peptidoglycan/xylan/chitin deacetylase (PgdA/CDA1 family)